jgi:hypothetical protein
MTWPRWTGFIKLDVFLVWRSSSSQLGSRIKHILRSDVIGPRPHPMIKGGVM